MALARRAELARGVLGYAAAFAGERYLVSVELAEAFELVIRAADARHPGREIARIALGPADYDIHDLAVDAAHERAFVASADGRVRGFDIATGARLVTWHMGSPASAVAVAPDGRLVAMGTADGVLCLRRYDDGALLHCALAHTDRISDLDFSADGEALASASWDGEVVRWRVPSLGEIERVRLAGPACAVAFAPADRRLAVAQSGFAPRRTPDAQAREAQPRGVDPEPDHAVIVWTPGQGGGAPMVGHQGPVTDVVWTPDGRRVVSSSWDRTVRLWDVARARQLDRLAGFSGLVHGLAADRAGRRVVAAAWTDGARGSAMVLIDLLYPARGPGGAHGD